MDGDNGSGHTVQYYGSCQPDVAHCTNNGHADWNFATRTEFTECDYQGIKDPATGETYPSSNKVLELEVTSELASGLLG